MRFLPFLLVAETTLLLALSISSPEVAQGQDSHAPLLLSHRRAGARTDPVAPVDVVKRSISARSLDALDVYDLSTVQGREEYLQKIVDAIRSLIQDNEALKNELDRIFRRFLDCISDRVRPR